MPGLEPEALPPGGVEAQGIETVHLQQGSVVCRPIHEYIEEPQEALTPYMPEFIATRAAKPLASQGTSGA